MLRSLLLASFCCVSWLHAGPTAMAQTSAEGEADDEARWRFQRARVDFEAGRYREALDNFERAYELSGHAELLFNIGQSASRLALDERALEAFEGYLEAAPEAENRDDVMSRIQELRARIAAEQSVTDPEQQTTEPADEGDSGSIFGEWWFWAIVGGVVVAGAVVAIAVATSGDSGPDQVGGDLGEVFEVLSWR